MIVHARTCHNCGDQGMKPKRREWTGMETTVTFSCSACGNQVELNSVSHAGLMTAMGLILLAIVTAVMAESSAPWEFGDYILYGIVLIACVYLPANILVPHWRYPQSNQVACGDDFDDTNITHSRSDPIRRRILKFERYGFWRGFFTPILFIAVVLAVATAIGLINFYVFQ